MMTEHDREREMMCKKAAALLREKEIYPMYLGNDTIDFHETTVVPEEVQQMLKAMGFTLEWAR